MLFDMRANKNIHPPKKKKIEESTVFEIGMELEKVGHKSMMCFRAMFVCLVCLKYASKAFVLHINMLAIP